MAQAEPPSLLETREKPPAQLAQLPVEILAQIFRNLCIHCWYGNHKGHGGSEALVSLGEEMFKVGRDGRKALAKVCRTSKAFAAIAQPILFHFYHTGNQPVYNAEWKAWKPSFFVENAAEDDLIFAFIRTLLKRRDLATHVRALALYYSQSNRLAVEDDEPDGLALNPTLLDDILAFRKQELEDKHADHVPWPDGHTTGIHHEHGWNNDLCDVVVALSPNVEQLHMGGAGPRTFGCGEWMQYLNNLWYGSPLPDDEQPPEDEDLRKQSTSNRDRLTVRERGLCRLQYAAFSAVPFWCHKKGGNKGQCLLDTTTFLRHARNLETLVIAHRDNGSYGHPTDTDITWPTTRLKTLRIGSSEGKGLAILLTRCPELKDLTYSADSMPHSAYYSWFIASEDIPEHNYLTDAHLQPLYPHLRRLCYTYLDSYLYTHKSLNIYGRRVKEGQRYVYQETIEDEMDLTDPYVSFREFQQLSVLEVEHPMFHSSETERLDADSDEVEHEYSISGPRRFLAALPDSLRILHLGFVADWTAFYSDMAALCEAVQIYKRMPLLRLVHIEYVFTPPEDDVQYLTNLLWEAGISFRISEIPKGDFIRGLVPERPGYPYGQRQLGISFGLECLNGLE